MTHEYIYIIGSDLVLLAIIVLTVITIWQRRGAGSFLCDDCRFNNPAFCLKTERPYALDCTSYRCSTESTDSGY